MNKMDELPTVNPKIDYREILPIQQKRTIAFINNFIMSTVSFLNTFAQSCESRLMEFEYKLQNVEAQLLILEAQLSSISGLNTADIVLEQTNVEKQEQALDLPEIETVETTEAQPEEVKEDIKPTQNPKYQRFFKMIQVGVPIAAVKLKMESEGFDSKILNKLPS